MGSVGKMMVCVMVIFVLENLNGYVYEVCGNFNNYVGVLLMLLCLYLCFVVCVLEFGMNYVGEILEFVEIVKLDIRVFLNVGFVYMENFFGGLEEVVVVKGEIF